jgi:hypothetical protein
MPRTSTRKLLMPRLQPYLVAKVADDKAVAGLRCPLPELICEAKPAGRGAGDGRGGKLGCAFRAIQVF